MFLSCLLSSMAQKSSSAANLVKKSKITAKQTADNEQTCMYVHTYTRLGA